MDFQVNMCVFLDVLYFGIHRGPHARGRARVSMVTRLCARVEHSVLYLNRFFPMRPWGGALITLICLETAAGCRMSGRSTAGWAHLSDQPPSPWRRVGCGGCGGGKAVYLSRPRRSLSHRWLSHHVQSSIGHLSAPPLAVAPRGEFRKQVKGPFVAAPPVAVAPLAHLRDLCCP